MGISAELSEEIEAVGDGGGWFSSQTEDCGVCRSLFTQGAPVRRRFEGGMFDIEGECARLSPWSDPSMEPTDERGEPGESREAIVTD